MVMFYVGGIVGFVIGIFLAALAAGNKDAECSAENFAYVPAGVGTKKSGTLKFIQRKDGQWRWKLVSDNNKNICGPGETFNNRKDAEDIALSIIMGDYSDVPVEYQHHQPKS